MARNTKRSPAARTSKAKAKKKSLTQSSAFDEALRGAADNVKAAADNQVKF